MILKKYLPEYVYGGVDGLVTTFAIVTAAIGIGASAGVILVMGIANVLADAFSMGSSNYLASHSEANLGDGINTDKPPLHTATATFGSFVVVGVVPLIPFVIAVFYPNFTEMAAWVSVAATMVTFFLIGYTEGKISGARPIKSALRTLLVGAIAALISFAVGYLLKDLA